MSLACLIFVLLLTANAAFGGSTKANAVDPKKGHETAKPTVIDQVYEDSSPISSIDAEMTGTSLNAAIVSDTIPSSMVPGKSYTVSVTVQNDSSVAWTEVAQIRLGAVGDSDPFAAGRQYLPAGLTVEPGQQYTFSFQMEAPLATGQYVTDWQMVQEGVNWFGQTLTKTITVSQAVQYAYSDDGRLQYVKDLNGRLLDFQYDANGNQLQRSLYSTLLDVNWENGTSFGYGDTYEQPPVNISGYLSGVEPIASQRYSGDWGLSTKFGEGYLMVAAKDDSATESSIVFRLFDNQSLPVTNSSQLRYWIYPAEHDNSRYVYLDLEFTDGTRANLTQSDVPVNRWSLVKLDLAPFEGKTIRKVLAAYDRADATGPFRSYFDELMILSK